MQVKAEYRFDPNLPWEVIIPVRFLGQWMLLVWDNEIKKCHRVVCEPLNNKAEWLKTHTAMNAGVVTVLCMIFKPKDNEEAMKMLHWNTNANPILVNDEMTQGLTGAELMMSTIYQFARCNHTIRDFVKRLKNKGEGDEPALRRMRLVQLALLTS